MQFNNLLALFDNWDKYKAAIEESANAVGTLQEQQDIYAESTRASLQKLETVKEELFGSLLDADTIKNFAGVLEGVVKTLNIFVNTLGGGGKSLLAFGSIATGVFSKQLAQGIATSINNLKSFKANLDQIAAEQQLVNDIGRANIQDTFLGDLVSMKQQVLALGDVVSQEQNNAANDMIRLTNELNNQKVAWNDNLKLLSDFFQSANQEPIDLAVKFADYSEISNYIKAFDEIKNNVAGAKSELKSFDNVLKEANKNVLDNTRFPEDAAIVKKLGDSYAEVTTKANGLAEEMKVYAQNAYIGAENQKILTQAIREYYAALKNPDANQAFVIDKANELSQAYHKAIQDVTNYTKEMRVIFDQELEDESGKIQANLDRVRQQWTRTIEQLKTVSTIRQVVNLVGAVGRLASAFHTLSNIMNTLEDESIPAWEKLLRITMAVGFGLPMLISSAETATKSLLGIMVTLKLVQAETIDTTIAAEGLGAALLGALAPYLPIILAVTAAIGGIVLVANKISKALNASEEAAKRAAESVKTLTTELEECKKSAEELNNTISGYKDAKNRLEELEAGTEEYAEALDEANKKAKDLIATHKLFDEYRINSEGLYEINQEALDKEVEEGRKDISKAETDLYSQKIIANAFELEKQRDDLRKNLDTWIIFSDEELAYLANEFRELSEITGEDTEALKAQIEASEDLPPSMKRNIDTLIDNRDALIKFSETLGEAAEANEYYSKMILRTAVERKYGEEISDLVGENNQAYQVMVEAFTSLAKKGNEEVIKEQLSNIKVSGYGSNKQLNENFGYDIFSLGGDWTWKGINSLLETYAKELYDIDDIENLKYNSLTGKAKYNGEIVFEKSLDEMRQELAELAERNRLTEEISLQTSNISKSTEEALEKIYERVSVFDEQYATNFANAIIAAIANDTSELDFSSFVNSLTLKDKQYLESLESGQLLNLLGITEEDLQIAGSMTAEQFTKSFRSALDQFNISDYITRAQTSASTAQDALDKLSANKLTIKETQELEDSLKELGKQYEELGEIQNKTSHEYLSTLRRIKEEEENNALEGLREKRLETLEKYQEEVKSLKEAERDFNEGLIDEYAFNEQLNSVKESLQEFLDTENAIKLQIDLDLRTDVSDAFGIAEELESLRDAINDDLYYTFDEAQELINAGFGEMFINADIVAKEIEGSSKNASQAMIQADKEAMNAFIDHRQAEINADREAKISQLEMERALIVAQQQATEEKIAALQQASEATTLEEFNAAMARVEIADAEYRAKTQELQDFLKQEALAANESQDTNKSLYDSLGKMYDQDSQNQQQAIIDATNTQAREINKQINNYKLLNDAVVQVSQNIQKMYTGGATPFSTPGSAQGGGAVTITGSKEVEIVQIEADTKSFEEFKSEATELFKQNRDAYLDLIKSEIDLEEAKLSEEKRRIGEIDAGIAALKSADLTLDRAQREATPGGIGKSGGGSGGAKEKEEKEPDLIEHLEEEADRYHDINLELESLSRNFERLGKIQENLYGEELLDNLEKQLEVLEKQKEATAQKYGIALAEQMELQKNLRKQGVAFDEEGYINNYAQVLKAKTDYVNSVIDQYNQLDRESQEKYKEEVDKAKEELEELKSYIERYDELISSFMPDLLDDMEEQWEKQFEINIKKFTMEVELRIEMGEAERDFNEFKRKVLDEIKEDDILGNARSQLKDYTSYFDTEGYGTGAIQKLTDQLYDTMDEIDQMDASGNLDMTDGSDIYGIDKAQAMADLQKYYEELTTQLENIVDLVDKIKESYLDMIDEMSDAFDEQVDKYDYISDLLNHDMNVIGLVYGDKAYREMARYYEQIEDNNNQELDFLKKRVAYAREMMDTETDPKARKKWEEEWMNSLKKLNDKVESSIKNINDKYQNAVKKTFDDLNKKVTDGKGLDYVSEEWDLINKNADQYLDTINRLYAVQNLENKYLDALDSTDSLSAQQKLNDMMNEQLDMLRDKDKLTKYDVERANMLYEIALKQIALEEAQQNKSQMRLRRDSQGNYRYEFVTDEDDIGNAQDELLTLQNDLYNFDKEHYKENLNDIYEYYLEFQQKYEDIMLDMSLTDEERQERVLLLTQQYGDLINGLVEQNEDIKKNLRESAFDALKGLYEADSESFEEMTGENAEAFKEMVGQNVNSFEDLTDSQKDLILSNMIPQWDSGVQHMADTFANEGGLVPVCTGAMNELDLVTQDYQDSLDELEEAAGIDFDSIGDGYDENIDRAQDLLEENDNLIEKYRDQITAIREVLAELDRLMEKYKDAYEAAKKAAEAAYEYMQAQREAAAEAAATAETDYDYTPPAPRTPTPTLPMPSVPQPTPASSTPTGGDTSGGTSGGGGRGGGGSTKTEKKKIRRYLATINKTMGVYYAPISKGKTFGGTLSSQDPQGKDISYSRGKYKGQETYQWFAGSTKLVGYIRPTDLPWRPEYYDTGGYTGKWGKEGRLAVLHEKELILNKSDTENMLAAVGIVRNMASLLNNLNDNIANRIVGLSSDFNSKSFDNLPTSNFEQQVHIDATFPNVQNSREIEEAFKNLTNIASQRAFNTRR